MDERVLKILKKIYKGGNSFWNELLGNSEYRIPDEISRDDLLFLEKSGFKPNNFEVFEHDNILDRLIAIQSHPSLTLEFVSTLFINSLTEEFPRGRQPILSYLYAKRAYKHEFINPEIDKCPSYVCDICGLGQSQVYDKTMVLMWSYNGNVGYEIWPGALIDLEEIVKYPAKKLKKEGLQILKNLLKLVSLAETNETPSRLIKRVAQSKMFPKTPIRYIHSLLVVLAELGILKNNVIPPVYDEYTTPKERRNVKLRGSSRSDIMLPLAAWRGDLGVNYSRAKELFGI